MNITKKEKTLAIAGAALGAVLALTEPAEIEARLFPIAGSTTGSITVNTPERLCWQIKFKKLRSATPVFFSWVLYDEKGQRFYLAQRLRTGDAFLGERTSKKGDNAVLDLCAPKPDGVQEPAMLKAYAEYEVFHRLWRVPREVGPFVVPKGE